MDRELKQESLTTVSVSSALRLDMALEKAHLGKELGKALDWNEWIALLYSSYLKNLKSKGIDRKIVRKKEGDKNEVLATKQRSR